MSLLPGARGAGRGPQVEIVLRQIDRAAIFSDEGMRVAVFAAGIVELETRNGWSARRAGMASWSSAAVNSSRPGRLPPRRGIRAFNGDVEDTGRLAQARLRSCEAHSIRKFQGWPLSGQKK